MSYHIRIRVFNDVFAYIYTYIFMFVTEKKMFCIDIICLYEHNFARVSGGRKTEGMLSARAFHNVSLIFSQHSVRARHHEKKTDFFFVKPV